MEKTIYVWNSTNNSWEATVKYNYDYNTDGKLLSLSLAEWNELTDTWAENVQYAMYLNDRSEEMLSINYLDTKTANSELNLTHYSY